jgi:hypothetical protein
LYVPNPNNPLAEFLFNVLANSVGEPGGPIQQFREISGQRKVYLRAFSVGQLLYFMRDQRPDLWQKSTQLDAFFMDENSFSRMLRSEVNF